MSNRKFNIFQVREEMLIALSEVKLQDASTTMQISSTLAHIVGIPDQLTTKAQVCTQDVLMVEVYRLRVFGCSRSNS